jgi:tRNA(His) guanylyltransferase
MDDLGTRMKRYEEVPRTSLTPRAPMIVRVDGRAFHTYTRGCERPWDTTIRDAMTAAASALMREITGAKIAYLQSDEISILATDYDRLSSQAWFDKVAQKICSVTSSVATAAFNNKILRDLGTDTTALQEFVEKPSATFDSRCFIVPREDVTNYFVWRQRDAEKNSVSMLAQSQFSHAQLQGKNGSTMQDMLMLQKGINWNDIDVWKKRGWCVLRDTREVSPGKIRTVVEPDWAAPIFSRNPEYIERFVNVDVKEEEIACE